MRTNGQKTEGRGQKSEDRKMKDSVRPIKRTIDGLLARWQNSTIKKGEAVRRAWKLATDERTRMHAQVVNLKNKRLMVTVTDSSWLYKLSLEKRTILDKFNKEYSGRKKAVDIRFRVGILDSDEERGK